MKYLEAIARAAVIAALLQSSGCASGDRPAKHILLVTIDTMRWDRLGFVGHEVETPNLDRLASQGAYFASAISAAPQTLPSHSSILTGAYPIAHGARNNGIFRLGDDVETLAEVFDAAGFRTGGFIGSFVLERRFGLDQGFDHFDDDLPEENAVNKIYYPERPAQEVVARATDWIEEASGDPFFVWVHVFDPHAPYLPPPPFDKQYEGRLYDGEIAHTDQVLGPLLERVGAMEDSLVVVTADHGESLGEHGESTHGLFIYDSTVRVPLLMKGVGIEPGTRVDPQVRTVDIAPTILELAKLRFHGPIDGESLVPYLRGESPEPRTAYSESFIPRFNFNWSELRSLRDGEIKWIRAPRPELYDLVADPGETANLAKEGLGDRRIASELDAMIADDSDFSPTLELDAETASRLESLGYVGGAAGGAEESRERPDPKDRVELYERMQGLLSPEVSPEEAIAGYREILAAEPENAMARNRLANTLSEEKRLEEAVVEYRRLIADSEIDFSGFENLAAALLLLGRNEEALDVTSLAIAEADWNPTFMTLRGEALEKVGRLEEALEVYSRAIELDDVADSYWRRGAVAEKLGDSEAAERDYRRALEKNEALEPALIALSRLLAETGRVDEALSLLEDSPSELDRSTPDMKAAFAEAHLAAGRLPAAKALLEEALETSPNHSRVLALLGPIYAQEGRLDDATELLERALDLGETAPEIRRNLAVIYTRQRKLDAAIAQLGAAVETAPKDASLWYTFGNTLFQARQPRAAADAFARALELRPRWPEAAFNLGMASDAAGRASSAHDAFQLYLEVGDPSDAARRAEANKRLERLSGGR